MRYLRVLSWMMALMISAPGWSQVGGQIHFEFKGAYADRYVFRGKTLNDDNTLFGAAGIGLGQWSYRLNYVDPLSDDDTTPTTTRLFQKEYAHELTFTSLTGNRVVTYGYQFYDYSESFLPDTQELFFRVAYNTLWNPSYGIAYDFDSYRGFYVDASVTRFRKLTQRSQLVFNLLLAGSYRMTEELGEQEDGTPILLEEGFYKKDGLSHTSVMAKYLWSPRTWLQLETGISYHYALDGELHEHLPVDRGQTVWRSAITVKLP